MPDNQDAQGQSLSDHLSGLLQNDAQFRLLLDHSPDAIFVMDPHDREVAWRIVACNDFACRMNGYTREELLGHSLHILDTGDSRWVDDSAFLERLRREHVVRGVTPHRRKDNSILYIEYSTSLITVDGREYALGVDRDLTERQRIEQELQRAKDELELRVEQRTAELAAVNEQLRGELQFHEHAEQALRASSAELHFQARLLDAVDQAIITTDLEGRVTYWNRFAETLFGWSSAEVIGQDITEVMPSPELEQQGTTILEHVERGANWSGTIHVRRRDGTILPTLVASAPLYDTHGTLIGAVGVSIDITTRVRAEERSNFLAAASAALVSSLDYTSTATRLARLAVAHIADWCIIDLATDDHMLQPLAVAHADPEKEPFLLELRQRYPLDLRKPQAGSVNVTLSGEAQLFEQVTDSIVASFATDDKQLALFHAIGYGSTMVAPLTARGQRLGAITFATTDLNRPFDTADLNTATELAYRTALAIDNARLYQEAQQAIHARDEFLSIAAHELKTPVTSVLGYGEMLQLRFQRIPELSSRDQRAVRTIVQQAERLSRLVTLLLDIARLETGHFSLDLQLLDLCTIAERVADQIDLMLEDHTLEIVSDNEPLLIEGDDLRLEQAILNLVQNAVKYSPEGGPIIMQLGRTAEYATVAVIDQGLGIPAEVHDQLFNRFFRANIHNPVSVQGMGIGLYVVKEVVSHHGGRVEVESIEGVGSTFTLYLPLALTPAQP